MQAREKILLIGGGGHCKSVIDVIEQESKYEIVGIIDKKELIGEEVLGYQIIDTDENLSKYLHIKNILITVGQIKSPDTRIKLFEMCKALGFTMPVIISSLAYISKHAQIGEGSIVMHHALVNAGAKVGRNCIINTKALIEHDAVVGDNCHISTGSIINGGTKINENTFFGSNAMAKEYIEVRAKSVIGGGVTLLKSL